MAIHNLRKIFRPQSIAVVGVSSNPDHVSNTVMRNLLAGGFDGPIYVVDPNDERVLGRKCYNSVNELPTEVDLAVVCAPAAMVPEITRQCVDSGVTGMVVISAGFSEIGIEGRRLEQQVIEEASRSPELRILGPKSLGLVVPHRNLNISLSAKMPRPGRIAFVSQSGTLCNSALDWAIQENIGFSYFVSIGSMLNIGVGDLVDYFAMDPHTNAIILYVESIKESRGFMSAARAIVREKPIVIYKAGRYAESARAAISHTGSMSGVDEVYEAAFERAGIVRVSEIDDMFDCAHLLASVQYAPGPRLAIVTNAGGPGVVATDSLISRNGVLAQLSKSTMQLLNDFLPPYWSHSNPVDILGDAPPERFKQAIDVVLQDRGVDALLVVLTPQSMTAPSTIARMLVEIVKKCNKPILAAWMGGAAVREGIEILNKAGVPTYTTPKSAVHAFMHLVSYSRNREILNEVPRDVVVSLPADRQQHHGLLKPGSSADKDILSEKVSKQLLEAYGIKTTMPIVAEDAERAVEHSRQIGYPVVMKILSPQITHKNEVGGVVLNIGSDDGVRTAFSLITDSARAARPDANILGVTVQSMATAPDGIELILGNRKDAVFGPVILLGTGGIAAEVLGDFTLGLPPLNELLARRMIESLRTWPIISGQIRRRPLDVAELIQTIIRFSYLVAECPQIGEMDVNPLLLTPSGAIALDARVRLDRNFKPQSKPFSHLAIQPYPEDLVQKSRLNDGTEVVLRPIKPEDEPLWHAMLSLCSSESIRHRFRSMFKQMTHEMASRLCFVDYDRELAIVAETTDQGKRQLIGVAHLFCDTDHHEAEFAILVPDPWHRHGVGSKLTQMTLDVAREWGLTTVVGYTERSNRGMKATFVRAGFELDYDTDPDVIVAQIKLQPNGSVVKHTV